MVDLLKGLNPEQRQACDILDGPLLILAGAGSGKTRTLTHRIARLIEDQRAYPWQILAVTFTNKAAGEMRERLERLIGPDAEAIWCMTFHALCVRILRKSGGAIGLATNFAIADSDDQKKLIREILAERAPEGEKVDQTEVSSYLRMISRAKNEMEKIGQLRNSKESWQRDLARVWTAYQQALLAAGSIDFDDLLLLAVKVLETEAGQAEWVEKFRYLHVDEYQDSNAVQTTLLRQLATATRNLCVVGDECQPAGTLVTVIKKAYHGAHPTRTEQVPIENIRIGDSVVSYDIPKAFLRRSGSVVDGASSREYDGPLVTVTTTSGLVSRYTENHHCLVRIAPALRDRWVVYLMRRGRDYRVGLCPGLHTSQGRSAGFRVRARKEQADAVWLLGVYNSRATAVVAEQRLSWKFGVPQLLFQVANGSVMTQAELDEIWQEIGDNYHRVEQLLKAVGKDIQYPIWQTGDDILLVRRAIIVHAINLIDGMEMLPLHGAMDAARKRISRLRWEAITVQQEPYQGQVYSLSVAKDRTYVADNIITHNCQAIYGWRGAQVEHILRFSDEWPEAKTVKLEQNYRSSANIIEAANAIIAENVVRSEKQLIPVLADGDPVRVIECETGWDEADFVGDEILVRQRQGIDLERIAIVYRTNAQSRVFEERLNTRQIDYHIVGGLEFYRRAEVKTARSYLSLLLNANDRLAFERVIALPRRGVGQSALAALQAFSAGQRRSLIQASSAAEEIPSLNTKSRTALKAFGDLYHELRELPKATPLVEIVRRLLSGSGLVQMYQIQKDGGEEQLNNLSELESLVARFQGPWPQALQEFLEHSALVEAGRGRERPGVSLMTLHATKGLEFDTVFLVGVEEEYFLKPESTMSDIEESRRLFYVGMTRAEQALVISYVHRRMRWGDESLATPVRFLANLPESVERSAYTAPARHERRPGRSYPERENRSRRFQTERGPRQYVGPQANTPARSGAKKPGGAARVGNNTGSQSGASARRVTGPGKIPDGLHPGVQVTHPKFGTGVVIQLQGNKATIAFKDKSRILMADMAPLSVLS